MGVTVKYFMPQRQQTIRRRIDEGYQGEIVIGLGGMTLLHW
jgi:hypothetical protein